MWRLTGLRRAAEVRLPKLPTAHLPDAPTRLPSSRRFAVERSGCFNRRFVADTPQFKAILREAAYAPPLPELWSAPTHEALTTIASMSSYYTLAAYAAEHGYYFLAKDMLLAGDAPLPHIVYEDIMKTRTFGSRQDVPEAQFALDDELLRIMFCMCAHHILLDPDYMPRVEALFRTIEQQQQLSPAVLSAWVWCCAAAGLCEQAASYLAYMEQHRLRMDPKVFALMMHPATTPASHTECQFLDKTKGMLMQERLCARLQGTHGTAATGAHALFVFYSLTLNHVKKWEIVRAAAATHISLSQRTLDMLMSVFREERGQRCGPKTYNTLVVALAEAGRVADVVHVLMAVRKLELLPEFIDDPPCVFAEAARVKVMNALRCHVIPDDFERFSPVIYGLMAHHERSESVSFIKRQLAERTLPAARGTGENSEHVQRKGTADEQHRDVHEEEKGAERFAEPREGSPQAAMVPERAHRHTVMQSGGLEPRAEGGRGVDLLGDSGDSGDDGTVRVLPYMSPLEIRHATLKMPEAKDLEALHSAIESEAQRSKRESQWRQRMGSAWITPD